MSWRLAQKSLGLVTVPASHMVMYTVETNHHSHIEVRGSSWPVVQYVFGL